MRRSLPASTLAKVTRRVPLFSSALNYCTATLAALLINASPAPADIIAGRALARDLCSQCHDIGEPPASDTVRSGPDFRKIAHTRSKLELKTFLAAPHKRMRKVTLSTQEISDLIAYIELMKSSD